MQMQKDADWWADHAKEQEDAARGMKEAAEQVLSSLYFRRRTEAESFHEEVMAGGTSDSPTLACAICNNYRTPRTAASHQRSSTAVAASWGAGSLGLVEQYLGSPRAPTQHEGRPAHPGCRVGFGVYHCPRRHFSHKNFHLRASLATICPRTALRQGPSLGPFLDPPLGRVGIPGGKCRSQGSSRVPSSAGHGVSRGARDGVGGGRLVLNVLEKGKQEGLHNDYAPL